MLKDRWRHPGRLVVFVSGHHEQAGEAGADWHDYALGIADVAAFWWPGNPDSRLPQAMLAACEDSQRAVLGAPPHAEELLGYADRHGIAAATTLDGMISAALGLIGSGARRTGGEREVPLPVWRSASFQRWYAAQTSARNTLVSARLAWTLRAGPGQGPLTYWALCVHIYVSAEDRVKSNEVVISRPISPSWRSTGGSPPSMTASSCWSGNSAVPPRLSDGFIHELPGGSGDAGVDAREQAATETLEETGLAIDARRIRRLGSRQLAGTMSADHARLFSAEISDDEIIRPRATQDTPHGAGDTERTWVEVTTFGNIRTNHIVDWATLGMIAEALLDTSTPRQ